MGLLSQSPLEGVGASDGTVLLLTTNPGLESVVAEELSSLLASAGIAAPETGAGSGSGFPSAAVWAAGGLAAALMAAGVTFYLASRVR